jgi:hypothetical protein
MKIEADGVSLEFVGDHQGVAVLARGDVDALGYILNIGVRGVIADLEERLERGEDAGDGRQQLMEREARRVGDPLVGKALEQLKGIVRRPPPTAKPPPGVKTVVYRLTDPFERTKVTDSIANGHAYDKHVVAEGQFKVDDGHGGKRIMTQDEFSAEIQKVLESQQTNKCGARPVVVSTFSITRW